MKSDGSTADYYKLPEGATDLQHLISHRDMNAQIGEIFRSCYRYGQASHSDRLRDAKKILFYAKAEVARLERLESHRSHPATPNVWDEGEKRMDNIARSHGDGEHYGLNCGGASFEESADFDPVPDMTNPANWRAGDWVECVEVCHGQFTPGRLYQLREDVAQQGYKCARVYADDKGVHNGWGVENFKFHARPEADGWIKWDGGECPVIAGTHVEVRYRYGGTASGEALNPDYEIEQSFWDHDNNDWDIIAYRPVAPSEAEIQ